MLAPWKECYNISRQHIKKQRHHFADKDLYSQSYGFSSSHICMWELEHKEGWVLKNWCFWIVVLEKHLECPFQRDQITSILKEINHEYSLEGLMLKLQHFGHLTRRVDSPEKTLMLRKIEAGGEGDDRGWDGWMASPTQWTWVWPDSGRLWRTGKPGVLQSTGSQVGHDRATERQQIKEQSQDPTRKVDWFLMGQKNSWARLKVSSWTGLEEGWVWSILAILFKL